MLEDFVTNLKSSRIFRTWSQKLNNNGNNHIAILNKGA